MKPTLDQEKGEAVQCKGRACTEAQGQEGHRSSAGYHSAGWTGVGRGVWSSVSQGCERWTQRCREETELESHLRGCLGSTPVTSVSLSLSFPHMCNGVFRARGGVAPCVASWKREVTLQSLEANACGYVPGRQTEDAAGSKGLPWQGQGLNPMSLQGCPI